MTCSRSGTGTNAIEASNAGAMPMLSRAPSFVFIVAHRCRFVSFSAMVWHEPVIRICMHVFAAVVFPVALGFFCPKCIAHILIFCVHVTHTPQPTQVVGKLYYGWHVPSSPWRTFMRIPPPTTPSSGQRYSHVTRISCLRHRNIWPWVLGSAHSARPGRKVMGPISFSRSPNPLGG